MCTFPMYMYNREFISQIICISLCDTFSKVLKEDICGLGDERLTDGTQSTHGFLSLPLL